MRLFFFRSFEGDRQAGTYIQVRLHRFFRVREDPGLKGVPLGAGKDCLL